MTSLYIVSLRLLHTLFALVALILRWFFFFNDFFSKRVYWLCLWLLFKARFLGLEFRSCHPSLPFGMRMIWGDHLVTDLVKARLQSSLSLGPTSMFVSSFYFGSLHELIHDFG